MPSIQIKDVPEDVHRVLRGRAAREGRSLQQYLLRRLIDEARHPSLDELFDRLEAIGGGAHFTSFDEINDIIREDRESH